MLINFCFIFLRNSFALTSLNILSITTLELYFIFKSPFTMHWHASLYFSVLPILLRVFLSMCVKWLMFSWPSTISTRQVAQFPFLHPKEMLDWVFSHASLSEVFCGTAV